VCYTRDELNADICYLTATEQARLLRSKQLSAREVMEAHLEQIARINPQVNAIVTLAEDQARSLALAADEAAASGVFFGPLHGLPVAHKDLAETRGMRTTFGSPIFHDYVPDFSTLLVERTQRAGAITIGKTNTPEFGAGSQTFNPIFGPTRNPWDLSKTCGGSSGGAAVALACGMLPIADGSDLGGSLRNPASFCSVVGFRPSPGRVAYMISKLGMARVALGVAAEHLGDNIAGNTLWPRTIIETQASIAWKMADRSQWRTPEIVCDASLAILAQEPRTCTGQQWLDEVALTTLAGISNFDHYWCEGKPPANPIYIDRW